MSKLNGTLTQIRWETTAAANTCAACCSLQNKHLGSIWLIMIYFSCDHLFMLLWFIFLGTGLHAKGLGVEVGKHPPSPAGPWRDPQQQLLQPHMGTGPPTPPAPWQPIPEDAAWLELHSLTLPFLPTDPLALEPRTRHAYIRTSAYAV